MIPVEWTRSISVLSVGLKSQILNIVTVFAPTLKFCTAIMTMFPQTIRSPAPHCDQLYIYIRTHNVFTRTVTAPLNRKTIALTRQDRARNVGRYLRAPEAAAQIVERWGVHLLDQWACHYSDNISSRQTSLISEMFYKTASHRLHQESIISLPQLAISLSKFNQRQDNFIQNVAVSSGRLLPPF